MCRELKVFQDRRVIKVPMVNLVVKDLGVLQVLLEAL